MEERCCVSVGKALCGKPTEGRGIHYAVAVAPIQPADRWLPLCEQHARELAQGFTITTAEGGMIDIPPAE